MVFEHGNEYESQWEAIRSIAAKIGCSAETLRKWVRRVEVVDPVAENQVRLKSAHRIHDLQAPLRALQERAVSKIETVDGCP